MQNSAFNDVACKYFLLSTSAAKYFFKTLQRCRVSSMHHDRVEIMFHYCELSSNNAWCCRADANINSLRRRRLELILRNLPSNTIKKYICSESDLLSNKSLEVSCKVQLTLVISISLISNNRLSRSAILVPVLTWKSKNR